MHPRIAYLHGLGVEVAYHVTEPSPWDDAPRDPETGDLPTVVRVELSRGETGHDQLLEPDDWSVEGTGHTVAQAEALVLRRFDLLGFTPTRNAPDVIGRPKDRCYLEGSRAYHAHGPDDPCPLEWQRTPEQRGALVLDQVQVAEAPE